MSQFHFDAGSYADEVRREVPAYDELQAVVADAAAAPDVAAAHTAVRVLDLGAGTGETSLAVLTRWSAASLVLLDESSAMLAMAADRLPAASVERVVVGDLLDPLPPGPFDAVISALAIHHLDGPGKRKLFARVRELLGERGRFVMGDVVIPNDPVDAITPLSPDYDRPDRLDDLVAWLDAVGFAVSVQWTRHDLAVVAAEVSSPAS